MDLFHLKTDQEIKKMINDFWEDTEYLMKIRILLRAYPGFNITKLESRNIEKMWKSLSLKKQKDVYQDQHLYQI
ncbi:hypothetical protein ES695_07830 [Candidatus Atribacteria bacterium 1244-E10-H5-B2]|nr:MAG: hypothetical protein ES695_07830 [Candidatus Atribacteria bacterium 1244-E10-H5-B2]